MLEDHPSFTRPELEGISIWRYMDLAKFLDLITSGELPFVRADLLGDPWEGAITASMARSRDAEIERVEASPPALVKAMPFNAEQRKSALDLTVISCWRMSEVEDVAMWSIYGGKGIAVRSTFANLTASIDDAVTIYAGTVTYVDFDSAEFDNDGNPMTAFMHKRIEFEYERELRLMTTPDYEAGTWETNLYVQDGVVMQHRRLVARPVERVRVDLALMINEVVLAPSSPSWVQQGLRKLLDAFELRSVTVRASRLSGTPTF